MHAGPDSARGARPRARSEFARARGSLSLAAVVLVFGVPVRAYGATADGTLITNVASATYNTLELDGSVNAYTVSFNATAYVLVASPNIQLQKTVAPTVACSGGTVTFCLAAVNASVTTSAFNVVLWDKLTTEYGYVNGGQTSYQTTAGGVVTKDFVYGDTARTLCGLPCGGPFPFGGAGSCPCPDNWGVEPAMGALGPIWMKWVVNQIGPGKSAVICFQATLQ